MCIRDSFLDAHDFTFTFAFVHFLFGQGEEEAIVTEVVTGAILSKWAIIAHEGGEMQLFEVAFQKQERFHHFPPDSNGL